MLCGIFFCYINLTAYWFLSRDLRNAIQASSLNSSPQKPQKGSAKAVTAWAPEHQGDVTAVCLESFLFLFLFFGNTIIFIHFRSHFPLLIVESLRLLTSME